MNRLSVTVVDILGVLIPGAMLLASCVFLPAPLAPIPIFVELVTPPLDLLSNPWIAGGAWLTIAYILGFLLRLISIPLLSLFTKRTWAPRLQKSAETLHKVLEDAIGNEELVRSLKALSALSSDRDPSRHAPYFHFAKRLVRRHPDMWAEAERLEAEMRFAAGLLLPFLLLLIDGILLLVLSHTSAWALVVIGALGVAVLNFTFPSRRVKEVLYIYYLALVILGGSQRNDVPEAAL